MPRDIPLGNGHLFVAFDRSYALRDLSYPHVGMENHVMGRRCRLAVRVDEETSWVGGADWTVDLAYEDDTVVSKVRAASARLELELHATDAVDWQRPVLVRRFRLRNLAPRERMVRVLLHHDLDLLESDSGVTTYFDTRLHAMIHYKRRRWVLANLMADGAPGVGEWSCDHRVARGGRGTRAQIEDEGRLNGNPISLGAVDSAIAATFAIAPGAEVVFFSWLALAHHYQELAELNAEVIKLGPDALIERTRQRWRTFCRDEHFDVAGLGPGIEDLARRSLLLVRTHADAGGGIVAAHDSDTLEPGRETYAYVWMRDGAIAAEVLSRAGDTESARRFFRFCSHHLTSGGFFLHRYHTDGSLGSSWLPWIRDGREVLPIQEDETALVLWALGRHYRKARDLELVAEVFPRLVYDGAEFLCRHRNPKTGLPLPSWDLWEERFGVHTFTAGTVVAALDAAADLAELCGEPSAAQRWRQAGADMDAAIDRYLWHEDAGRYARTGYPEGDAGYWLDTCVDASLAGLFLFGVRDAADPKIVSTMRAVEERLAVAGPVGGVARYENDPFCRPSDNPSGVPGNPWFVTTLALAECRIARATTLEELAPAIEALAWARRRALPSGVLAEQLHPATGDPLSVSPLTWSHVAFLSAALNLRDAQRRIADSARTTVRDTVRAP